MSTSPTTVKATKIEVAHALEASIPAPSSRSTKATPGTIVTSPSAASSSTSSPHIILGAGTISRLPGELDRLGLSAPLIVSSPSRIALSLRIQGLIPDTDSRILDSAIANVPAHVVEDAVSRICGRDCVVSIGGGSAVSLAKAISIRKMIPHICIPTTYSGSEMTPSLGHTKHRGDKTFASGDPKTLPTVIIYDEDLTASPSTRISAVSGSNLPLESHSRRSSTNDDSQWSYIHLPGV